MIILRQKLNSPGMKIKELAPGLYKIRRENYAPFGAKHSRSNSNTVQLLRVTGVGEKRRYFIDHDTNGQHPNEMNELTGYEILSRYEQDPQIGNCKITLSFVDAGGQEFFWTVRDTWALRNVLESISWLKKPFGYVPRRKR